MKICRILLLSVDSPALSYFSTLSHNGTIFGKKKVLNVKCVFLFSLLLSETFLPIVLLFLYAFCFNLYCGGFILFCNVCVCVCMCGFCNVCVCEGFAMCGCFCNMYTVL